MLEQTKPHVEGYVKIIDRETREVLLSKKNAIHFENFSQAIALSLSNRATGTIQEMVFGNGASTVSGTGAITYFPPNVTGTDAQLYNQTYSKIVNDLSPLNTDTSANYLTINHVANQTYSDIIVNCVLTYSEPSGQEFFDDASDNDGSFVFDEIGIKAFDPISDNGKLLTHVIFHPIQKALNREIEVVYTLRIFMT